MTDLATGTLTQVASFPEYDHQVAWAPDGRRLGFERDSTTSFSIYTVNVAGCPSATRAVSSLVIYHAEPGSDSARSLALLGSLAATVWAAAAGRNYP